LEKADGGSGCTEELYGYSRMTIWK